MTTTRDQLVGLRVIQAEEAENVDHRQLRTLEVTTRAFQAVTEAYATIVAAAKSRRTSRDDTLDLLSGGTSACW